MTTALIALSILAAPARPGIMWFTDLSQGLAEARRTNKPVFLLSAAPQCTEIPGDW